MQNVYEQVDANKRKSFLLMLLFSVVIIAIGWAITVVYNYDSSYLIFALLLSGGSSLTSFYFSDKIVLALTGAKELDPRQFPRYASAVENMARVAGVPQPKAYVIDSLALNAFATGRDPKHAAVAVTRGLLEKLDRTELEGVLAHEISHIKNFDTRLMTIVAVLVGSIAILLDWSWRLRWLGGGRRDNNRNSGGSAIFLIIGLVLIILAPIIANLIKFAISRRREYLADASGVKLTRQPSGLISALNKISSSSVPLETASSATAHLFISNPLKNRQDISRSLSNLFSTHPPIEERIRALEAMA